MEEEAILDLLYRQPENGPTESAGAAGAREGARLQATA